MAFRFRPCRSSRPCYTPPAFWRVSRVSGTTAVFFRASQGLMVATLFLMGCVLAPGQAGDRADWLLAPRLSRAQEFVYGGSFAEESTGGNVQFNRAFRLESRLLVLDAGMKGAEVALLTILKACEPAGSKVATKPDVVPNSVRLEIVQVD